ncbi:MAG: hypothetical protein ABIH50_01155, partial [bacterium]
MSIKRERLIPLIFFFVIFFSSILVHILGFAGLDSNLETAFGTDGSTTTTTTLAITSFTLRDRVSGSTTWTKSTTVSWEVVLDGPFTQYQVTEEGAVLANYIPIVSNTGTFTFSNATNGTKHAYYYGKLTPEVSSAYAEIGLDTVAPYQSGGTLKPITGECIEGGSGYSIGVSWSDTLSGVASGSYPKYYSTNEGTTWLTCSADQSNPSGTWSVPNVSSTECLVSLEAHDNAGNYAYIKTGKFTIDGGTPEAPTLTAPADNTTTSETTPTFSWTSGATTISGNGSYEVTIGATLYTQEATTATITPTLTSGTYTWKVRTRNKVGRWGPYSLTRTLTVDAIAPTVLSVGASSPVNGTYGIGQTITVTVECSENVTVTGQPSITMETGTTDRQALYSGGSGSSTLTFLYTVEAGDASSDLDYVATDSLVLNGGTMKDAAGNNLTRTLAAPGAAGSLGFNRAYVIVTTPPTGSIKLKDRTTGSETITNSQTVTVEATITSGTPSQMRISEEASFAGAAWTAYVNPTTYTFMTATNELKRVYYGVSDEAVNITTYEATITLDTAAPTVTVEAPNGGEILTGGGTYTITWEATDVGGLMSGPITLRYSQDSGATWTQIAASLANTGTYSWSVPVINKTTCRVSVEAEDNVGLIG